MPGRFYVTTPIYYVNDRPHIGHAYVTFAADVIARYQRMRGTPTHFLTGTDENAEKNVEAARAAGETNVREYVDRMSAVWQSTWDELGIANDDFIRTTEERHLHGVALFWKKVEAAGDIYKGTYEGLYCTGCETFYRSSDLTADGFCLIHNRKAETLKEENYFFRLGRYRDVLLKHLDDHPTFILPETRRHEVRNYIEDHLEDMSISRPNRGWGIPVPGDDTQTIYVWFDALLNYLTAVGYGTDDARFSAWWPATLHLVGKDIIKFHCALWPAMLLSAGIALPEQVFAHGFFTIDGKKISKSLGNAIDPRDLVETYGVDAVRYFLLREIPFGADGDFSIERLTARYDSDLASGLGNFVSRVLTLARDVPTPTVGDELRAPFAASWTTYHAAMATYELNAALEAVWQAMAAGDRFLDATKPWDMKKDPARQAELAAVIGTLLEATRQLAWMLLPFMPSTAGEIFRRLGTEGELAEEYTEATTWGSKRPAHVTAAVVPLFPRFEADTR